MTKIPTNPGYYWLQLRGWSPLQVVLVGTTRINFPGAGTMSLAEFQADHPDAVWSDMLHPPSTMGATGFEPVTSTV